MSRFIRSWNRTLVAAALAALACSDNAGEVVDDGTDDLDQFVATGKTDTGYVSDKAAEVWSEFTSSVTVDLKSVEAEGYGIDAADKTRLTDELREKIRTAARNNDLTSTEVGRFASTQVKFSRNALKSRGFNANLESAPVQLSALSLVGNDTVRIDYVLKLESLVKLKELPAGKTIDSLVGQRVELDVPQSPDSVAGIIKACDAAKKAGNGDVVCAPIVACSTDPDNPAAPDAETQAELNEWNYFYYWNPARAGCGIETSKARFTVKNLAPEQKTYPEFDKLLSSKTITGVAVFGQLEHGELKLSYDEWGWIGYYEFTEWLEAQGFSRVTQVPSKAKEFAEESSQWKKVVGKNLTVVFDVVSPLNLQDNADQAKKDAILKRAVKEHEVVYYNGHSFYGALKVLDDPANFAPYYQLVFMDSCWSYAYYTKQVFAAKKKESDPTGMLGADVLNSTEPAISGSHATFQVLLKKLLFAASKVADGSPASVKNYTWKNLVAYMNASADSRAARAVKEGVPHSPEIYGASGVSTNVWKP